MQLYSIYGREKVLRLFWLSLLLWGFFWLSYFVVFCLFFVLFCLVGFCGGVLGVVVFFWGGGLSGWFWVFFGKCGIFWVLIYCQVNTSLAKITKCFIFGTF